MDKQPGPKVWAKKGARDRLIRLAAQHPGWVLGFQDETWWSRVKPPNLHAWSLGDKPLRLVEHSVAKEDGDPKALACYGILIQVSRAEQERIWLRFVDGRPVSETTIQFLEWCCAKLEDKGKSALLLIWDNASWHTSRQVSEWLTAHNRLVKQTGEGVRIISCFLPTKSPWLNPIEPHWLHAKRQVAEPDRLLPVDRMVKRICAHFNCPCQEHLSVPQKVA